jgi:hypothetical protein
MTDMSCYIRIPIWNKEFCVSYSEENTRLGLALDGYPDGTTQILLGKLRARMSPGAKFTRSEDLTLQ